MVPFERKGFRYHWPSYYNSQPSVCSSEHELFNLKTLAEFMVKDPLVEIVGRSPICRIHPMFRRLVFRFVQQHSVGIKLWGNKALDIKPSYFHHFHLGLKKTVIDSYH